MTFRVRRKMVALTGSGWAVVDYDGKVLQGRWDTEEDANEEGLLGVYLLSGMEVRKVED